MIRKNSLNLGGKEKMKTDLLTKFHPFTLSLLRIVAGFLFWQRGMQKLFGLFGGEVAPTFSLLWSAGVLESLGGPLIALGLLTRPVALVLAGEMATAYWIVHRPQGFWPLRNGGEVALLFLIIFLCLVTFGPGKIAVDAVMSKRFSGEALFDSLRPVTLNLLRIFTGILFWQHGASKFGLLGGRMREFPDLSFFAGVLEFFGGPLIALGAFTQPVAFILSGEMAYAFWFSHVPRGPAFWPVQNGGELAVLFCFIYLFLVAAGPGRFSVDGLLRKKFSKG